MECLQKMDYQTLESTIRNLVPGKNIPEYENVRGGNFITPEIITVRKINGYTVEFSYGKDICKKWIIGVSVSNSNDPLCDLSTACYTQDELIDAIAKIKAVKKI